MDNKKTFEVMLDLVADAWEKEGHTDEAAAIRKALSDYTATIEKWDKKRKENEILQQTIAIGSPNKNGIYEGSIIWQYFALGKKKFSDLKF